MSKVNFTLYLPNHGVFGDARLLADLAFEAEEAGWDGVFPLFSTSGDAQLAQLKLAVQHV